MDVDRGWSRTATTRSRRPRPKRTTGDDDRSVHHDLSTDCIDHWTARQTEALGPRRLERLLRVWHQHPRQPADAERLAALRPADAERSGVQAHPARVGPDDVFEHLL